MSNYLSNLATRSAGVSAATVGRSGDPSPSVIRPRLASMFEPVLPLGNRQPEFQSGDEERPNDSALDRPFHNEAPVSDFQTQTIILQQRPTLDSVGDRQVGDRPQQNTQENLSAEELRLLLNWAGKPQRSPQQAPASISTSSKDTIDHRADENPEQKLRSNKSDLTDRAPQTLVQPPSARPLSHPDGEAPSSLTSRGMTESSAVIVPANQHRTEQIVERVVTEQIVKKSFDSDDNVDQGKHTISAQSSPIDASVRQIVQVIRQPEASLAERSPFRAQSNRPLNVEPIVARPRTSIATRPPASTEPDNESRSQPTIHVTIGRIEVRAAQPPSQPQQRRGGSSTMSLDDYLKKRSKGGGR